MVKMDNKEINKYSKRGFFIILLLVLCFIGLSYIFSYFFISPDKPAMNYFLYSLLIPVILAVVAGIVVMRFFRNR